MEDSKNKIQVTIVTQTEHKCHKMTYDWYTTEETAAICLWKFLDANKVTTQDVYVMEHHNYGCYQCKQGRHYLRVPKITRPYTLDECRDMLTKKCTRVADWMWVEILCK